ncbi:MAG: phosphorylase, partial [Bacteroidia bacterium]|nr:phosphorylase [Bacteroidia bacterium]
IPMAFPANAPEIKPDWESKFQVFRGITATSCGFYAPQGRSLGRTPLQFPNLQDKLAHFRWEDRRVLNFEMETSAIFMLGGLLGHRTASLSVVLANRARNEFSEKPEQGIDTLIDAGLEWITT